MSAQRIMAFRLLSKLFGLLSMVAGQWKLLLVAALFLFDTTPHLRWEYTYRQEQHHRIYMRCTYLGVQGFVIPAHGADCPLITLLNTDEGRTP